MFLRLIIIFFGIFFLFGKSAWAGACDTTISSATTTALTCADNDTLTVDSGYSIIVADDNSVDLQTNSASDVTITNAGTIKAGSAESTKNDAIEGTNSTNLIINNSGTIQATNMRGIFINNSTNMTITNESTGTIKADVRAAIYGNATDFTIHNYGTIDSDNRTIEGTSGTNYTINNYDGGIIVSTSGVAIKWPNTTNTTINNYSGAIIHSPNAGNSVYLKSGSTVTIYNEGEISTDNSNVAIMCQSCANVGITNSGTITAGGTVTIDLKSVTGTNTVTNTSSGTISAVGTKAIRANISDGLTITNSGTISSDAEVAIDIENSTNATLNNSGTISATTKTVDVGNDLTGGAISNGSGAVIDNSGTIEASASNGIAVQIGDGRGVFNNVTLTNSGTISALDDSINIYAYTTGTKIIVDGEPTFTGEIDMNSTATTMTLSCTLTKDLYIEIHGKTNMTVTNNLCGNDTYEILDSSKNADADNSETDGYLRIYGEDLDIAQDNAQYRSENVLSKLRGILNAASTDKDFQTFRGIQKRAEYRNTMSGVVGSLNANNLTPGAHHYFISYTDQRASFGNNEYMGGENLALGFNKKFSTNQFNYYITSLIGLADLKITDVETEDNQSINTTLMSQFMGLDAGIEKVVAISKRNAVSVEVQTTYGLQRFPGYTASFTDGDLLVDDAVDQVLGANFEIRNSLGIERNMQLYLGGNWSETLSDEIEITADGENKNVSPEMQNAFGHYAGLTLTTKAKGFNLDFNLEYGRTGGLTNQTASLSLTKSF